MEGAAGHKRDGEIGSRRAGGGGLVDVSIRAKFRPPLLRPFQYKKIGSDRDIFIIQILGKIQVVLGLAWANPFLGQSRNQPPPLSSFIHPPLILKKGGGGPGRGLVEPQVLDLPLDRRDAAAEIVHLRPQLLRSPARGGIFKFFWSWNNWSLIFSLSRQDTQTFYALES